MLVAGFTVNLLTLLAIVLSSALVVDRCDCDGGETVERHIHEGSDRFSGAIGRRTRVVGPIIAMTNHARRGVCAESGSQGGVRRGSLS